MSQQQKYSISANKLTRRLYNIDEEDENMVEEVEETIENFTRQIKNSGWEQQEAAEIVKSGYINWIRRLAMTSIKKTGMTSCKKEGGGCVKIIISNSQKRMTNF